MAWKWSRSALFILCFPLGITAHAASGSPIQASIDSNILELLEQLDKGETLAEKNGITAYKLGDGTNAVRIVIQGNNLLFYGPQNEKPPRAEVVTIRPDGYTYSTDTTKITQQHDKQGTLYELWEMAPHKKQLVMRVRRQRNWRGKESLTAEHFMPNTGNSYGTTTVNGEFDLENYNNEEDNLLAVMMRKYHLRSDLHVDYETFPTHWGVTHTNKFEFIQAAWMNALRGIQYVHNDINPAILAEVEHAASLPNAHPSIKEYAKRHSPTSALQKPHKWQRIIKKFTKASK